MLDRLASQRSVVFISSSLFACIVCLDWLTSAELTLSSLYLAPIAYAGWRMGITASIAFSLLSTVAIFDVDVVDHVVFSRPFYLYWSVFVHLSFYVAFSVILDRARRVQMKLDALARTDELTGLLNYRAFTEACEREIARHKRTGKAISVAHIDLDGFKAVNDSKGHGAGDLVLVQVGRVLSSGRGSDIPARVGGDEFVVLMPETSAPSARKAVERLRAKLLQAMSTIQSDVTFSIGVASFAEGAHDVKQMMRVADEAMYRVKHSSKNAIRVVSTKNGFDTLTQP